MLVCVKIGERAAGRRIHALTLLDLVHAVDAVNRLVRHADGGSARPIAGPDLGQIKRAVDQGMSLARHMSYEHADLSCQIRMMGAWNGAAG